ncbi:Family U48 unassigned peptidase (U48 family) [Fasciolopsis buskii]|uniref:CAAX prenyl protease 2 n=1 Tax=Fasciolopsis buskii TaxID=27845 RepID=A0A8E0S4T8_9TREM|nr:Family U48 unassigned peptidase (U48 family) [Fasciolopsis buski]
MEYRFHFSSESLLVSVPSNQGWIVVRNLVVAPLAEEFVFRAAVMFHMKSIFRSCQTLCLVSPLFFSLAHFHHVYGEIKHGKSFQSAVSSAVFQVCYTTVFGIYSGFLMLRTGNVISAILAHSICNCFGLPDPLGAIERGRQRWGLIGLLLAIATHLIGLALWYRFLYLATSPFWFGNLLGQCTW